MLKAFVARGLTRVSLLVLLMLGRDVYMRFLRFSYSLKGVMFRGLPRYIHSDAFLDAVGGLEIGRNIVISTGVTILTHDYSYTAGLAAIGERPDLDVAIREPVVIGDDCFIGAGAIILPGSRIGNNVIVGAGSVIKGRVEDRSVVAGNPARKLIGIDEWMAKKRSLLAGDSVYQDSK